MENLKKKIVAIDRVNNFEKALKDLKDLKLISNKNNITTKGILKLAKIYGSFCHV